MGEREIWSRLRVTRETVAQVLAELSGQDVAETAPLREPVARETQVEPEVRVVGAVMVPHWREGLTTDVLPDVYRDIVEVIADASGSMQAKQGEEAEDEYEEDEEEEPEEEPEPEEEEERQKPAPRRRRAARKPDKDHDGSGARRGRSRERRPEKAAAREAPAKKSAPAKKAAPAKKTSEARKSTAPPKKTAAKKTTAKKASPRRRR
ncbi:hypothetical protein [Streptomyces mirabilis]|uniref:hypothetical protein n=1 Tax=Streptomyces mirabilis TaxID=68239 RepID=UPI0036DD2B1D